MSEDIDKALRSDILSTIDGFIHQVLKIRKMLVGVSISGIILAPIAIGLASYLLTEDSLPEIIDDDDYFGEVLLAFLTAVVIISSVWFTEGIRQYRSMSSWQKRYDAYLEKKGEVDKKIESLYDSDEN